MEILVTGGLGYIGVNLCRRLSALGIKCVIIDRKDSVSRAIESRAIKVYKTDILDSSSCRKIFSSHSFSAVINLAGLKSVSDSYEDPDEYFAVN